MRLTEVSTTWAEVIIRVTLAFGQSNRNPCDEFMSFFPIVPQGPPTKVKAEPESTTSIKVSWHEVHWKKIGGVIIQYILELHNGSQKIGDYNVSGNELSYVVKGLQVFSNYSARVQAVTALGAGPFSGFENTSTHQPGRNLKCFCIGSRITKVMGLNIVRLNFFPRCICKCSSGDLSRGFAHFEVKNVPRFNTFPWTRNVPRTSRESNLMIFSKRKQTISSFWRFLQGPKEKHENISLIFSSCNPFSSENWHSEFKQNRTIILGLRSIVICLLAL